MFDKGGPSVEPKMLFLLFLGLTGSIALASPAEEIYDFIIVGGGTAGSVVAAKLSENRRFSVLLLHEGGLPDPKLEVPGLAPPFWRDPNTTMAYPANTGFNYPATPAIVGRVLGGASEVGAMFYNRGHPKDYDLWAKMSKDPSWNYRNMLKYFKKLETYAGDFPSDQHGYHGPIGISRPKYAPGLDAWLTAGRTLSFPIADPNGPQTTSFNPCEFNKRSGRRDSAFKAFLEPILRSRQNLKVLLNSEATRIIFHGKAAVGVTYITSDAKGNTSPGFARAKKEIILSAGFIGSPMLLMRSGVGPEDVLQSANIQPVKILPVGRNLQDHAEVHLDFVLNNKTMVHIPERDLTPAAMTKFINEGDGPYSFLLTSEQAFVASSVAKQEGHANWADLYIFTIHDPSLPPQTIFRGAEIADFETRIVSTIMLGRPKSVGVITLNATNINGPPVINFQFLSNPVDRKILLDGIKTVFKIFETPPYRHGGGARYTPNPFPSCQHLHFRSDEYWNCYMEALQTAFHGSGTCKMGSGPEDPTAVVDSKLRVIGIDGLRVIDASIMPAITNANIQAPVFAIAEKATDDILERWKEPNYQGHGYGHRHGHQSRAKHVGFGWIRNRPPLFN